jgi:hypothetical protein
MSTDELYVKKAFDEYRLKSLEEGIVRPIKAYGFDGLDESIFVLKNSLLPGARAKAANYYKGQVEIIERELKKRPSEEVSASYKKILDVNINPATFNVLKEEREKLRIQRIMDMGYQGEQLYPSERFRRSRQNIEDTVSSGLSIFGRAGEYFRRNRLWFSTAAFLIMTPITIQQYVEKLDVYNEVASEYVQSHEVGPNARALKRDIPSQLENVVLNLTHTSEVSIELDEDTEFTIPEKLSDPQAARINIHTMGQILKQNISPEVTNSYKTVFDEDKRQILAHGAAANSRFESAYNSLAFASNPHVSYPVEMGITIMGNSEVQKAVSVMEKYMPKGIIEEENSAHTDMTIWKWLARISGGLTVLFGVNAYRNHRRRKLMGEYY